MKEMEEEDLFFLLSAIAPNSKQNVRATAWKKITLFNASLESLHALNCQ